VSFARFHYKDRSDWQNQNSPLTFPLSLDMLFHAVYNYSKEKRHQMDFYNNLQLDPFVLKKKIHNSTSAKDRKILFATMLIRSLLIVGFAILFISTINVVFGAENSFLAVVLFCMLLSIRFVHFGYKLSHSIISIAIILGIIYMIPIVAFIPNIFLKMLINSYCSA
jgi:hypothetical protein